MAATRRAAAKGDRLGFGVLEFSSVKFSSVEGVLSSHQFRMCSRFSGPAPNRCETHPILTIRHAPPEIDCNS
ncbi:hypothetical protein L484_009596 [Morus notabilis]|uniref:Uncharacterized protein n=1 Tax=Morus notabilis TaxID=981085 RepID=W9QBT5_9ROSA|nr:hypothetical protein L484_009596 [Morus notabilis]